MDYGDVSVINPKLTEDGHKSLLSVGSGFRYNVGMNFSVSFDMGIQMKDSGAAATARNGRNKRAHLSVSVSY